LRELILDVKVHSKQWVFFKAHMNSSLSGNSEWLKSLVLALTSLMGWVLFGVLLSSDSLDVHNLEIIKVLHKGEVFNYLGVILAVQIPLFIQFLDKLVNSGFVYRKFLPRTVAFREVLVAIFVNSTLVLISPRDSFLYLPVGLLVITNSVAIYRSLTSLFNPERYERRFESELRSAAKRGFKQLMFWRGQNNLFFEKLKSHTMIESGLFSFDSNNENILRIRSAKDGKVRHIDTDLLEQILSSKLTDKLPGSSVISEGSSSNTKADFQLDINHFPGMKVSKGSDLAALMLPLGYSESDKLHDQILACFNIESARHASREISTLYELIEEFESQIQKSLAEIDNLLLSKTLDLYQLVLPEIDECIAGALDGVYDLENAAKEIGMIFGDEFSDVLTRVQDVLTNAFTSALKSKNYDATNRLSSFVYSNLLQAVSTKNVTSIARYDWLLHNTITWIIYDEETDDKQALQKEAFTESILHKLQEHTEMLLYTVKKQDTNSRSVELLKWRDQRLEHLLKLMIFAYNKKKKDVLIALIDITRRVTRNSSRNDKDSNFAVRSVMVMFACYIRGRGSFKDGASDELTNIFNGWSVSDITEAVVNCYDNDLADKWRINMMDLPHDGEMHSVPDYRPQLRSLWVELICTKHIYDDTSMYGEDSLFEKTLFFTDSRSNTDDIGALFDVKGDTSVNNPLVSLLKKLADIRMNYETVKLISLSIDQDRVIKFCQAAIKSYDETSLINKVIPVAKQKKDMTNAKEGFRHSGINQVHDKEAFVAEWHIGTAVEYMGEQLGRSIAQQQDQYIFQSMLKVTEERKVLSEVIREIRLSKAKWLVLAVNTSSWDLEYQHKDFVGRSKDKSGDLLIKGIRQFEGVKDLYVDDVHEGIYFIDINTIGELTAKAVSHDPPINAKVEAYSEMKYLMDGIIKSKPEWLLKIGDETTQRKHLSTKVRILVERIFKYETSKKTRVLFYPLSSKY
jgi:hypothetical protein